jgi:hypothetical protein
MILRWATLLSREREKWPPISTALPVVLSFVAALAVIFALALAIVLVM